MELKKRIELAAKDTVGYSEASNKESFMVGVSVALCKAEEHYEKELTQLRSQIENYKSACNIYMTDLKTLAYSYNNMEPYKKISDLPLVSIGSSFFQFKKQI